MAYYSQNYAGILGSALISDNFNISLTRAVTDLVSTAGQSLTAYLTGALLGAVLMEGPHTDTQKGAHGSIDLRGGEGLETAAIGVFLFLIVLSYL